MSLEISGPDEFMKKYEEAANSRNFENIKPLISENAVFWFSDGSYRGIRMIRSAFESTWNTIMDEVYSLSDMEWIHRSGSVAICIYRFVSTGKVHGEPFLATGLGTSVLVSDGSEWKILHEHLSLAEKE